MNGMEFVRRIDGCLDNQGKKRAELLRDLNLPRNSITNWDSRGNIPAGDICMRIADYLGVGAEWLLTGRERETETSAPTDGRRRLAEELESLAEEQRRILERIEGLAEEQRSGGGQFR